MGSGIDFIWPMKAKELEDPALWNNSQWIAERKYDGERYTMYILPGGNRFLSRRASKEAGGEPADKTDRLPHLRDHKMPKEWHGTVVDGEVLAPNENFSSVVSIMGSLPERAIELQKTYGWANYIIFDVLRYKGNDVMNLPLYLRRKMLLEFAKAFNSPHVIVSKAVRSRKREFYERIVALGGEGVMLKDLCAPYTPGARTSAWLKFKKQITVDAVIMGFQMGQGKYNQDRVGAIVYGTYGNDKLVEWGTAGGITVELSREFTEHPEEYIGQCIELECQEVIKHTGNLRHPRFFRFRPDKDPKECKRI